MAKISCKNCGKDIPAENVNIQKAIAKCQSCDCIFQFDDQIELSRPEVGMPDKYEVLKLRSSIDISYSWLSPKYYALVFFTLFWNGFMAVWYYLALTDGEWFMALFGVLHLGVGIFLFYTTLAGFVNSTHINATRNRLEIRHRPLWWMGNRAVEVSEIDQLFCKLQVNNSENGTTYAYHLYMIDKNKKHTKLISNMESPDQVLYLEQEIENFLGIKNRRVKGELEY